MWGIQYRKTVHQRVLEWSAFKIYFKFPITKAVIYIIAGINQNQNSENQYVIGHYNPSVWIIDLVSHNTYVLKNFSFQFYFTLRIFARNLLIGNRRRNTFRILF